MDSKGVGIVVKMMKGAAFAIRLCFRKVCDHPLLVGMLCFLIYLYVSFPLFFSWLLAVSPVLVCTAILLGVLLSYGEPNFPQVHVEERKTHDSAAVKIGLTKDSSIGEESEGLYIERLSKEPIMQSDYRFGGDIGEEYSSDADFVAKERSQEVDFSDIESIGAKVEVDDLRCKDGDSESAALDNDYGFVKLNDEPESGDEKSECDSFDSERVNVDSLDSLPRSPWRRFEEVGDEEIEVLVEKHQREEEEEEEDDAYDSESDHAEGSSPDASMADILPMLDELHPLLDEETPQPIEVAHGDSDAASERSSKLSSTGNSDAEIENHEDLEVADEENEDVQGENEEQTKSAITWTEEDQKNLMDLGSSEIERNQRLENLIMRRRARKTISIHERNLIDLETYSIPYGIAPISTKRQNPFDVPNDLVDSSGLPHVPGSAPSVLLNRRNPFDIPYDSGEEKPNLGADDFHEEFMTLHPKDPVFRRHESFNVGPSIFALNRQEAKMRPYFVPERTFGEDSSSYSSFQRQLSEISESKVSSIPETESPGSVEDMEEKSLEAEAEAEGKEVTDAHIISLVAEDEIPVMDAVIKELPSTEPVLISRLGEVSEDVQGLEMADVTEHVGHGSQSSSASDDEDSSEAAPFQETVTKAYHGQQDNVIQSIAVSESVFIHSSSSSISEERERVIDEKESGPAIFVQERDVPAEERVIDIQAPVNIASVCAEDTQQREPIYDSSPREVSKSLSSSSMSSDVHLEVDNGLPPVSVNGTLTVVEKRSEENTQQVKAEVDCRDEGYPESRITNSENESNPAILGVVIPRESENMGSAFSEVGDRSKSESISAHINQAMPTSIVQTGSSFEAPGEASLMDNHESRIVTNSITDSNVQSLDVQLDKKPPLSEKDCAEVGVQPFEREASEDAIKSPNSDADVYHEASEKFVTTPSAKGNISLFYDKALLGHRFIHLNERKASSEAVPSNQKSDFPLIQELDQDLSLNGNPPLSPDSISFPSAVSDMTNSHMDLQTAVNDTDRITEIDGLLSELDHVGDFSIKQHMPSSSVSEKQCDTIEGSLIAGTATSEGANLPVDQELDGADKDKGLKLKPDVNQIEEVASSEVKSASLPVSADSDQEVRSPKESHSASTPSKANGKSSTSISSSSSDSNSSDSDND